MTSSIKVIDFKSRRGKAVEVCKREEILHVYYQVKEENPSATVVECVRKASSLTNVSERFIFRLLKEKRENGCLRAPCKTRPRLHGKKIRLAKYDKAALSTLRKEITSYFIENENPSIRRFLVEMNKEKRIFNKEIPAATFFRLLNDLGIRFHKVHNVYCIMQATDESLLEQIQVSDESAMKTN